ncbi:unnamed protein product [Schistosoma margrebowiei]|uniref:Uncharacterized protein n=1 Tax=Schistosoma margrebowiei TaxID=48269 RepID=A0A183LPU4_9TREM|nr:unnamed protein product [Schistosoma margrebowiei]
MVVGGSQQKTLDPGFVLFGFDPVSHSLIILNPSHIAKLFTTSNFNTYTTKLIVSWRLSKYSASQLVNNNAEPDIYVDGLELSININTANWVTRWRSKRNALVLSPG